jgi:hypothetical protein
MSRPSRLDSGLLLAALVALGPGPAGAAVVCQKGNKVKLRSTACKPNEVTVADLGGNLTGVWDHREGNGLAQGASVPTFLTLNADGTGRLNRREPTSQVISCSSLLYARGGGVPTMTLKESFEFDLVQAALESADVLRITDDSGTSVFDRVSAVDPAAECGTLVEVSRLSDVPAPFSSNIGLAFDGTSFVYIDDTFNPVIVDAATGVVGPPPTLGGLGRMPHAAEGGDIWGLCGCGGNDVASRSTLTGTVVDEVDTTTLLGSQAFLVALAVPTPGQLLMLAQEGGSTFSGRLLLVDTAAEPDTLSSQLDFDVSLNSMAHDGTNLWGLQGFSGQANVIRIDPATGISSGTFLVPDTSVGWRGVAVAAGQLFLVGIAQDGTGVIATFTAPAP